MARSKKSVQRRDWRKTIFYIIALIVVLSMVLSSIIIALQLPS